MQLGGALMIAMGRWWYAGYIQLERACEANSMLQVARLVHLDVGVELAEEAGAELLLLLLVS
jgi:hypothetical protein